MTPRSPKHPQPHGALDTSTQEPRRQEPRRAPTPRLRRHGSKSSEEPPAPASKKPRYQDAPKSSRHLVLREPLAPGHPRCLAPRASTSRSARTPKGLRTARHRRRERGDRRVLGAAGSESLSVFEFQRTSSTEARTSHSTASELHGSQTPKRARLPCRSKERSSANALTSCPSSANPAPLRPEGPSDGGPGRARDAQLEARLH
jgi:hypothetical protein